MPWALGSPGLEARESSAGEKRGAPGGDTGQLRVVGGDPGGLQKPPQAPCSSRWLPPPSPRQSTSCLCVWVPPSRCRPLPLPSLSHSQEGPCVGCSFAPRVSTARCYLGGPGTAFREPRERVSSGQAAKAVGLLPERVVAPQAWPRGQGRPPLGEGWRLVAWAPSWRLGSEGLCFGALGTIHVTEERERETDLSLPHHPPLGKGRETNALGAINS